MNSRVGIINCGVSNLANVVKAVKHVGAEAVVLDGASAVEGLGKLILPGVGSFKAGMEFLRQHGYAAAIRDFAESGRPVLGICLGMQMLLSTSEEFGQHEGLGLIAGAVRELPRDTGLKVPHVGWDKAKVLRDAPVLGLQEGMAIDTYFTHSFSAYPESGTSWVAESDSGYDPYASIVCNESGNVYGCQFHLELSGEGGLKILRNFVNG